MTVKFHFLLFKTDKVTWNIYIKKKIFPKMAKTGEIACVDVVKLWHNTIFIYFIFFQ